MKATLIFLSLLMFGFCVVYPKEQKGNFQKSSIIGQIERMNINRIDLGLENNGNTGLDGNSYFPNGQTRLSFLFAGGFACSGYVNGDLRTAWMASASRIQETQAGKWGQDPAHPLAKFYVVDNRTDGPGSQAYIDWANAVALGANFQDIDPDGPEGPEQPDGVYDPNVDRPDIIGDKIIWCVYNDGTPSTQRQRLATEPLGIEIHQLVWAFDRGDALGNVIFFRYRFINQQSYDIDDFIFTAWFDPDLGDYTDDLIGCDVPLSLGFIYNHESDTQYGANPPAFGCDFFQGPIVESPGDTAFLALGPFFGVKKVPDYRNLPMTSFMYYIQSHATIGDPNTAQEARYYQEGCVDRTGAPLNPPAWGIGGTPNDNPCYIYSGDPVTGTGWLDSPPADKRFMVNTGPFSLAAGDTQDVVVAYIVSRSSSALASLQQLKKDDILAQASYNNNFLAAPPLPLPTVSVQELDRKIELYIDLKKNVEYKDVQDVVGTLSWEGIQIYQFNTNDFESDFVHGEKNVELLASFDLNNAVGDLYEDTEEGRVRVYKAQNNLDESQFLLSESGLMRFTITNDVFNDNKPLVNFKTYYFAVVPFAVNLTLAEPNLNTAATDDYVLPGGMFQPTRTSAAFSARPGAAEVRPFKSLASNLINYTGTGRSEGRVEVDVLDRDALTGHDYSISFFGNGNFWRITDETTGQLRRDSLRFQGLRGDELTFPVVDGLSMRVYNVQDQIKKVDVVAAETDSVWLTGKGANSAFSAFAQFNRGIDFVHLIQDSSDFDSIPASSSQVPLALNSQMTKAGYFPVKLVFNTTNTAKGYYYGIPQYDSNFGWRTTFYRGVTDTYIEAYDVSNPNQPRQLNILFNSPNGQLPMASGNKHLILILNSDYDVTNDIYNPTTGTRDFRKDAYLACNLQLAPGTTLQAGRMTLLVTPNYPNSDADRFFFKTTSLNPVLTSDESRRLLDKVKVVPNPYFAYSAYERSYDAQVLKFIHVQGKATIRIFNIAGQLIKTISKTNNLNEVSWDLRNEAGLKVASGIYIAHVEVEGVGSKVIKFGVVQREDRIDRY